MSNLARTRAEGRARCERTRAHAEARAERRRNVAEEVAAAGATTVVGDGASGIGAEPVATRFAQRIDALHGEAGQILHAHSLSGQPALLVHDTECATEAPWGGRNRIVGEDSAVSRLWCQEN
jgi:hypothetical protein